MTRKLHRKHRLVKKKPKQIKPEHTGATPANPLVQIVLVWAVVCLLLLILSAPKQSIDHIAETIAGFILALGLYIVLPIVIDKWGKRGNKNISQK